MLEVFGERALPLIFVKACLAAGCFAAFDLLRDAPAVGFAAPTFEAAFAAVRLVLLEPLDALAKKYPPVQIAHVRFALLPKPVAFLYANFICIYDGLTAIVQVYRNVTAPT